MSKKKYPHLFDHLRAYYTKVAELHSGIPNPERFICRSTNSTYHTAFKLIQSGKYTEEQIISEFPLT